jgi:hypothetical protein
VRGFLDGVVQGSDAERVCVGERRLEGIRAIGERLELAQRRIESKQAIESIPGLSPAVIAATTWRAAASLSSCRMLPLVSTRTAMVRGLCWSV